MPQDSAPSLLHDTAPATSGEAGRRDLRRARRSGLPADV